MLQCNKEGYKANEYHSCLKKNKKDQPQTNITDHMSSSLLTLVSKVNLTTNNKNWWVDTGATRHICSEKLLLSEYKKLEQDEQLFIDNSAVSKVEGKETSEKKLTLNDVLYISVIHKNLISRILSKKGFKIISNQISLYLLRVGCMWVRVIFLMAYLRPMLL